MTCRARNPILTTDGKPTLKANFQMFTSQESMQKSLLKTESPMLKCAHCIQELSEPNLEGTWWKENHVHNSWCVLFLVHSFIWWQKVQKRELRPICIVVSLTGINSKQARTTQIVKSKKRVLLLIGKRKLNNCGIGLPMQFNSTDHNDQNSLL